MTGTCTEGAKFRYISIYLRSCRGVREEDLGPRNKRLARAHFSHDGEEELPIDGIICFCKVTKDGGGILVQAVEEMGEELHKAYVVANSSVPEEGCLLWADDGGKTMEEAGCEDFGKNSVVIAQKSDWSVVGRKGLV